MERRIVAFSQDDEGHWVAELECGHRQHMRHRPPFERRDWVTTPEGRESRIGVMVNCRACPLDPDAA
ncbi:MAG TPA: DUF3565 domain-containing protein [Vicinamibacterales bacterium]|jgi:hypothetical protein|nr:DUF3565 domain-containing protein [Vicinamibacterales bacterium]